MSTESLTHDLEAIHESYRRNFANRARASRDLKLLDQLIVELDGVAKKLPGSEALATTVSERQQLYKGERDAIAEIQAGGPEVVAAWRLVEWSDLDFWRYGRLFGGQNRRTRDFGLLSAMASDQSSRAQAVEKAASKGGTRLKEALEQLKKNAGLYQNESTQINLARSGLPSGEHARVLATLANTQFSLYRLHFADKPRGSRRPALLKRMIGSLKDIQQGMEALQKLGITTPAHQGNIDKVADRIRHHENELKAIVQARQQTATDRIAGMLGDDANKVFEAYRAEFSGKSRSDVKLDRLSELCELLQETARNMEDLQSERPAEANRKNLDIVIDTLKLYEREWLAIRQAQKK
jgi:hypothetical protein